MIQKYGQTPWKYHNELLRYASLPIVRLYFSWHGIPWQPGWRVFGLPLIQKHGGSQISIGSHLQMRNLFSSNPLGVNHRTILATWSKEAVIGLGDHVRLSGATICAVTSISIGNYVTIGANSTILDSDSHPLAISDRLIDPRAGESEAIVIEDGVFIGMQALILKGSHVGEGSVIGAGSVVAGEVPPGVIVAGNPATIIREL